MNAKCLHNPSSFLVYLRQNTLGGLTVSLAMLPEVVAYALVAGVSPVNGLYGAAIVSLISALWGGRPAMASGAAGALAVVIVTLVARHGSEYLFASVFLMGLFQILFAFLRIEKFIRMVPASVKIGFVNGLSFVTFWVQLRHLRTSPDGPWLPPEILFPMLGLILLTLFLVTLLPRFISSVPSPLLAIAIVSLITTGLGWQTKTISDLGSFSGDWPTFHMPAIPMTLETLRIVLPYGLIMAAVGLIETMLTLHFVENLTHTPSQPNKECMAQGLANTISGAFAGMGGCGMIGQSMVLLNTQARGRGAGVVMGVLLLLFVRFGSHAIGRIPLAALIGVMFFIAFKTFDWGSLKALRRMPRSDALLVFVVTLVTIVTDLASAVVLGVVLASLRFAWKHAHSLEISREEVQPSGLRRIAVQGSLYFASTAQFLDAIDPKSEDCQGFLVDLQGARLTDLSAVDALVRCQERCKECGKTVYFAHVPAEGEALIKRTGKTFLLEPPPPTS